jgi:putative transposase
MLGRLRSKVATEHSGDGDCEEHIWQRRFYDFVLWSAQKSQEKLHYIHQNPVERGLAAEPKQWRWSSARYYLLGERGPVLVNERAEASMRIREVG